MGAPHTNLPLWTYQNARILRYANGLAYHRKKLGFTQASLAKCLGCSKQMISQIETKKKSCPDALAIKIEKLFARLTN
jgi:DNA-binding XRE family transcriptional regulator